MRHNIKMTERELIKKLQELRRIKPDKEWAILAKNNILGEEKYETSPSFISILRVIFAKPTYAGLAIIFVGFFGTFTFAQNSLPGDTLYPIKKITERAHAIFVSEKEKPEFNLNLASKRLEELSKIAETNRVRNLPPAITETRASINEATKSLARSSNPAEIKKIVEEIENKAQAISQTLGVEIGEEELVELKHGSDKLFVKYLIFDLQSRTLTEKQKTILTQMQELADEEQYSEAIILFYNEFDEAIDEEPLTEEELSNEVDGEEKVIEEENIEEELKEVKEIKQEKESE